MRTSVLGWSFMKGSRVARILWARLATSLLAIVAIARVQGQTPQLPDGPGKEVTQRGCTGCHAVGMITSQHLSRDNWQSMVQSMIARGAKLNDEEEREVVRYLTSNFPPVSNVAAASIRPTAGTTQVASRPIPLPKGRTDWPSYGHDLGATDYSPLKQIDATNVSKLKVAWT